MSAFVQKVDRWLVSAGLLVPEESDDDEDYELSPPTTPILPRPVPDTPSTASTSTLPFAFASDTELEPGSPGSPTARRSWHRRFGLKITIPTAPASSSKSILECTSPTSPSPSSPRGPLSPKRLWNAVQRSTTSLPLPKRPKFFKRNTSLGSSPSTMNPTASAPSTPRTPRRSPRTPFKPSADPADSLLATAFKRAAMLQTLTYDDADAIMRRHRAPPPMKAPAPDASWYVPPIEVVEKGQPQRETVTSKGFEYVPLEDPRSFRWPETTSRSSDVDDPFRVNDYPATPTPILSEAEPEVRWYHALLIALVFHIFILLFAVYATLRVCFKPAVGLAALYCVVFISDSLLHYVL
ncbi:hypothetical protein C8F01DRAFT_1142427 [Mycena amicta]|nr:hypothetical protein C8F01DRAFT_1142427 [Mycena amicta]